MSQCLARQIITIPKATRRLLSHQNPNPILWVEESWSDQGAPAWKLSLLLNCFWTVAATAWSFPCLILHQNEARYRQFWSCFPPSFCVGACFRQTFYQPSDRKPQYLWESQAYHAPTSRYHLHQSSYLWSSRLSSPCSMTDQPHPSLLAWCHCWDQLSLAMTCIGKTYHWCIARCLQLEALPAARLTHSRLQLLVTQTLLEKNWIWQN